MKSYVIDLRAFAGKLRELISTGLQEHAFLLGWKGWTARDNPGEVYNTAKKVLYFDSDGSILHDIFINDSFDNTFITPADFLALTKEDVQDEPDDLEFMIFPDVRVLVRDLPDQKWKLDIFSHIDLQDITHNYVCVGGFYVYCIPYDGNEHLCGKVGGP